MSSLCEPRSAGGGAGSRRGHGRGALVAGDRARRSAPCPPPGQPTGRGGIMCEPQPERAEHLLPGRHGRAMSRRPTATRSTCGATPPSGRSFQLPGPTLCVTSGTTVTVTLHNTLPEPTSILWPGQDDVSRRTGSRSPSREFDGSRRSSTRSRTRRPRSTGTVTYQFTAGPRDLPLQLGHRRHQAASRWACTAASSSGPTGSRRLRERPDARSEFDPATEYLFLLSQIDPDLHCAVETNQPTTTNTSTRPVLLHQRAEHAGHARAEQRGVAAHPAVRRPRPHPADDAANPAGPHPLRQRRPDRLPVPPARQQPDASSPATVPAVKRDGQRRDLR